MKTTITSGQQQATLQLLEEHDQNPERYQLLLKEGLLADLFAADLSTFGDLNWLRNRIRISLGHQARGLQLHSTLWSFETLIKGNHYHKVRLNKVDVRPSKFEVLGAAAGSPVTITFDTIDMEDWPNYEAVVETCRASKHRPATPREFVQFDGNFPFVADYLPINTFTKLTMSGQSGPMRICVATNRMPGVERNLSFYPARFPFHDGGTRLLVARLP